MHAKVVPDSSLSPLRAGANHTSHRTRFLEPETSCLACNLRIRRHPGVPATLSRFYGKSVTFSSKPTHFLLRFLGFEPNKSLLPLLCFPPPIAAVPPPAFSLDDVQLLDDSKAPSRFEEESCRSPAAAVVELRSSGFVVFVWLR